MQEDIQSLSNEAAVEAVQIVSEKWVENRGLEFYSSFYGAWEAAGDSFQGLPPFVVGKGESTNDAGDLARHLLTVLRDSRDNEVIAWTKEALDEVQKPEGQIDPLTLGIGGAILIGAILAARVRKVGAVVFYEGIPESLADVLKVGVSLAGA